MYYFAYGTNVNLKDMGTWCELRKIRHIRVISKQPAILKDFQLVFDHYSAEYNGSIANVHPQTGEQVHGVLYNLLDEDFWIIKKKNGVPGICAEYVDPITVYLYDRAPVHRVKLFVVPDERCQPDLKPSEEYLKIIIEGARTENLSPAYISKLESIPTLVPSLK